MMLGFLLARAGIDVVVLEKHADFLRDFRGDTIHPSTLELMGELGLLEEFLKLPHEKAETISGMFGAHEYDFADFTHLPTRCKFVALMPQWDFLNFLADRGKIYPSFHLHMRTEATDLIEEGGRIVGVRASSPDGAMEIRAALTVACDGRHSTIRACAGFEPKELGAPMDVLWFRLPKHASDRPHTMGRFAPGHIVVLLDRGDYWQCAFVIPKGSMDETKRAGLEAFRKKVGQLVPQFADRLDELKDWDQIKLLTVAVNRLDRWSERAKRAAEMSKTLVYERTGESDKYFPLLISPENAQMTAMDPTQAPFVVANSMREVQPDINILVSPIPERLFARAPEGVREWSLPLGEDGA